jgi:alkaline phosphatase D
VTKPWPGAGYAGSAAATSALLLVERGKFMILPRSRDYGLCHLAGDRHSFWAGLAAKSLPPKKFEPVGSHSCAGRFQRRAWPAFEHVFPKQHPPQPLFVGQAPDAGPRPTVKVAAAWGAFLPEYQRAATSRRRASLSNPEHRRMFPLWIWAGTVCRGSVTSEKIETEFVCIRPLERSDRADGGPIALSSSVWSRHVAQRVLRPNSKGHVVEGDPSFRCRNAVLFYRADRPS